LGLAEAECPSFCPSWTPGLVFDVRDFDSESKHYTVGETTFSYYAQEGKQELTSESCNPVTLNNQSWIRPNFTSENPMEPNLAYDHRWRTKEHVMQRHYDKLSKFHTIQLSRNHNMIVSRVQRRMQASHSNNTSHATRALQPWMTSHPVNRLYLLFARFSTTIRRKGFA